MTISMDANFGLVRKKNSGVSIHSSDYSSTFFEKPEVIDEFVRQYSEESETQVNL